jgi:hypothetical protein
LRFFASVLLGQKQHAFKMKKKNGMSCNWGVDSLSF